MFVIKDENNYILREAQIVTPAEGENPAVYEDGAVEINEVIAAPFILQFLDYVCYKFKYVDINTVLTNRIIRCAMINEDNFLYDAKVCDEFNPITFEYEITEEQYNSIYDLNNQLNWKLSNGAIVTRNDGEKIISIKVIKDSELKTIYMNDILWTDDAKVFYDKLKLTSPNNTDYDAWYADVLAYWAEAQAERVANKAAVAAAETIANINAIVYNPTHTKTRNQIDAEI